MKFTFDNTELTRQRAGEGSCWLLTNGLGGYMSASALFTVTRCDQGLLVAAESPSRRYCLVHALREELDRGGEKVYISPRSREPGDGAGCAASLAWDGAPEWICRAGPAAVTRRCGMEYGRNASAVTWEVDNPGPGACTLTVTPLFQMAQKGEPPQSPIPAAFREGRVEAGGLAVYVASNQTVTPIPVRYEILAYPDDERDGRRPSGVGFACCQVSLTVPEGEKGNLYITFSTENPCRSGDELVRRCRERQRSLAESAPFASPEARELVRAADAFIAHRASTGGKTVIAGYPFFGDWGRDTMIALPGLTLATGRFEDARSILRTFIRYERDGLLPNYFPEGGEEPQYNSADAPLLFINGVWLYFERTGDADFLREAWPTVDNILSAYRKGARYAIKMDADGLISAGEGFDQVTWMDVRVGDLLPTPRHGKPVEINAYWYSALRAAVWMAVALGLELGELDALSARVRKSFNDKFWNPEKNCLRDVLSGTPADTQMRCNQIWAVSMPFAVLPPERERAVVEAVGRELWTSRGLRTLSPEDPEFRPTYGGPQLQRDLAYHQGTVWPFPAGAYYLAYLKTHGNTPEAARQVRKMLSDMPAILREGCLGQIPEIYDGLDPGPSRGCFAQAWSVGELLRVYERLEQIGREA